MPVWTVKNLTLCQNRQQSLAFRVLRKAVQSGFHWYCWGITFLSTHQPCPHNRGLGWCFFWDFIVALWHWVIGNFLLWGLFVCSFIYWNVTHTYHHHHPTTTPFFPSFFFFASSVPCETTLGQTNNLIVCLWCSGYILPPVDYDVMGCEHA